MSAPACRSPRVVARGCPLTVQPSAAHSDSVLKLQWYTQEGSTEPPPELVNISVVSVPPRTSQQSVWLKAVAPLNDHPISVTSDTSLEGALGL